MESETSVGATSPRWLGATPRLRIRSPYFDGVALPDVAFLRDDEMKLRPSLTETRLPSISTKTPRQGRGVFAKHEHSFIFKLSHLPPSLSAMTKPSIVNQPIAVTFPDKSVRGRSGKQKCLGRGGGTTNHGCPLQRATSVWLRSLSIAALRSHRGHRRQPRSQNIGYEGKGLNGLVAPTLR